MPSLLLTFSLLLVAWLAIYVVGKRLGLESRGIYTYPLVILYRYSRSDEVFSRLIKWPRALRLFGQASVVVGFGLMAYALWFLADNLAKHITAASGFEPLTILIPGITITNPELIAYFLISLPIILVVHEGAHGLLAKLEGLRIRAAGVGLAFIFPLGFVEPDEKEFQAARISSRTRIIAAGCTANIALALLLTPLVLGLPTMTSQPSIAPILPQELRGALFDQRGVIILDLNQSEGAGLAGLRPGDVIISINGHAVAGSAQFVHTLRALGLKPGDPVVVSFLRGGKEASAFFTAASDPVNRTRGVLGIYRFADYFEPRPFSLALPPFVAGLLFWVWFLSLMVGLFNMLPLKPLDGYALLLAPLDQAGAKLKKAAEVFFSALSLALLGANLAVSYLFYLG